MMTFSIVRARNSSGFGVRRIGNTQFVFVDLRPIMAVVLIVLAGIVLAGCGKNHGGPTGPTPTSQNGSQSDASNPGGPDCGPFGKKVYLKDDQGQDTRMWAILHWVRPACGKPASFGARGNGFQLHVDFGYDVPDDFVDTSLNNRAYFYIGFSVNGKNFSESGVSGPMAGAFTSIFSQDSETVSYIRDGFKYMTIHPPAPKFLLVEGDPGGDFEGPSGKVIFGLQYR